MKISVSLQGQKANQIDIDNLSKEIHDQIVKHIGETAGEIVDISKMKAPSMTGKMAASINRKNYLKGMLVVVRPEPRYGAWVEYGSGKLGMQSSYFDFKHRVPIGFPSVKSITPWALAKGLKPFLIARGIWRRGGIKPKLFCEDAAEAKSSDFISGVEEILNSEVEKYNRA